MAYAPVNLPTYAQFAANTTASGQRLPGLAPVDNLLQQWPAIQAGQPVGNAARTALLRQISIACSAVLTAPHGLLAARVFTPGVQAILVQLRADAAKLYKYEVFTANKVVTNAGPAPLVKGLDQGYAHEAPQVYNPPSSRQQVPWRAALPGQAPGPVPAPRYPAAYRYLNQTTASAVKDWMDGNAHDPVVQGNGGQPFVFANLTYDQYAAIEARVRQVDPNTPILRQYSKQARIDHHMLIPLADPNDGNRMKLYADFDTPFDTTAQGGRWQLFNNLTPGAQLQNVSMYIYAMDKYGNLYAQAPGAAGLHHSSFLRGKEVICAGQIVCQMGRLVMIDNASGHYKPTAANLREAVRVLTNQGFNFAAGDIEVDVYEPNPLKRNAVPTDNFRALQALDLAQQTFAARGFAPAIWQRAFVIGRRSSDQVPPNTWNNQFFTNPTLRRVYGSADPNCAQRAAYNGATFAANATAEPLLLEFTQLA